MSSQIFINELGTYMDFGMGMLAFVQAYPTPKTYSVSSNAIDGMIDLTEYLSDVKYENYIQTYNFSKTVSYDNFAQFRSDLMQAFHGKVCKVIEDGDLDYYRQGRCSVSLSHNGIDDCTITLSFNFSPYKARTTETIHFLPIGSTQVTNRGGKAVNIIAECVGAGTIQINEGIIIDLVQGLNDIPELFLVSGVNQVVLTGTTAKISYVEEVL